MPYTGGIVLIDTATIIAGAAFTGFTFTDNSIVTVGDVANFGFPLATSLFTINNKFSVNTVFEGIAPTLGSTGSVLDFSTRIDNTFSAAVDLIGSSSGSVFKPKSGADATINSVADAPISAGSITAQADNGAGGTTHSSTTTYFSGEVVIITGATSAYNGTFKIFNAVAGVSFDTITPFTVDEAAGSVAITGRLELTLAGGHGIVAGDDLKIISTNFYNGFVTALNVATNVLTINGTFVSTNTGSIERNLSLDETDKRVSPT